MSDSTRSDGPLDAIDDLVPPEEGGLRGMRALTAEQFSAADAVGGVRGVIESVAPGLLFVVVFIASGQRLAPALIAAGGAAVVAVIVRLVQRTPVTQAFSGLLGVGIGVIWAWRSGDASDYFAYGLWVNVVYLVGTLVSILVGLAARRARDGPVPARGRRCRATARGPPPSRGAPTRSCAGATRSRRGPGWRMFAVRLAVQVPLYLARQSAGWARRSWPWACR